MSRNPVVSDIALGSHHLCDAMALLVGTIGYLSQSETEALCLRRIKSAKLSLREAQDALNRAESLLETRNGT